MQYAKELQIILLKICLSISVLAVMIVLAPMLDLSVYICIGCNNCSGAHARLVQPLKYK